MVEEIKLIIVLIELSKFTSVLKIKNYCTIQSIENFKIKIRIKFLRQEFEINMS